MLSNLLSNAIKYSPDGGIISVAVEVHEGCAAISVADRGVGIPQRDLPHLFERYYRGSNVSAIVGTGIGLYFARMVAEIHGGTIAVESVEGEGSCFTLTLPWRPATRADAQGPPWRSPDANRRAHARVRRIGRPQRWDGGGASAVPPGVSGRAG